MTIRTIVGFPDPGLRKVSDEVTEFDDGLAVLVQDLTDTLVSVSAIGITGPHIGVAKRVAVLRMRPDAPARVYVNPRILSASAETAKHVEGSVSMPGVRHEIVRPARVSIGYRSLDGAEQVEHADGFHAACHQHEIDQLDGIFWISRLSALKREMLIRKFGKLGDR